MEGVSIMPDVSKEIRESLIEDRLTCVHAHRLAERLGVAPREIGEEASRLGVRISRCQLGLFGYQDFGDKRLISVIGELPASLKERFDVRVDGDRLSCQAAWEIASELGLPRSLIGTAADRAGVRIRDCQLGCFG